MRVFIGSKCGRGNERERQFRGADISLATVETTALSVSFSCHCMSESFYYMSALYCYSKQAFYTCLSMCYWIGY